MSVKGLVVGVGDGVGTGGKGKSEECFERSDKFDKVKSENRRQKSGGGGHSRAPIATSPLAGQRLRRAVGHMSTLTAKKGSSLL